MTKSVTRSYRYISAAELGHSDGEPPKRTVIRFPDAVRQLFVKARPVTVTFVVAEDGDLWIADRHSEHVQCARGEPVLSAGEITFEITRSGVTVSEVTNQSTGYCPEPESWPSVAEALDRAGLAHPGYWTNAFLFRRCLACGMTNIVKDGWFECGVCGGDLPTAYNFSIWDPVAPLLDTSAKRRGDGEPHRQAEEQQGQQKPRVVGGPPQRVPDTCGTSVPAVRVVIEEETNECRICPADGSVFPQAFDSALVHVLAFLPSV